MNLDYGYAPAIEAAQLDSSRAIWGARAIATDGESFDLVPGRASWYTEDVKARTALVNYLNNGVLDAAREKFAELKREHWDIHRTAKEYVLFEDDAVKVVGNTNASHGYLYLAAFIKPSDWTGKWVGDWRPVTGQRVEVTVNGIGPAEVLRGHRIFGVAGLMVRPIDPPDWYKEQQGLGKRGCRAAWVTGAEINFNASP